MRHSSLDLIMNVYTDPSLLDVAGAPHPECRWEGWLLGLRALDESQARRSDAVTGEAEWTGCVITGGGMGDRLPAGVLPVLKPVCVKSGVGVSLRT